MAKQQELKYVLGSVAQGMPADICFYDDVDGWSVDRFLWEFDWIVENCPSKIRIHINSCGGSCVDGMSVFTKILDCQIPTECINDGLAASMGSVIWAAGDEVYMKDYALLMIHNPFIDGFDAHKDQIVEAFTKQLKIIYKKRFGFDDEKIESIMKGEEGNDGTFFTASEAVENGFLSQDHIIETPQAEHGQIEAALKGIKDISKIKAVMDLAVTKPNVQAINKKSNNVSQINQKMKEEMIAVAALLGMNSEKASVDSVTASIKALQDKAKEFDTLKASYDALKEQHSNMETEFAASKASVQNLTADLQKANDSLKEYQDAEKAAFDAKVESLVDAAVQACKINKDDKESWVEMAKNNFDLTKRALDSIPAREDLGNKVGVTGAPAASDGIKTEEEKVKAKVDEVVGDKFEFRKMN